MKLAHRLLPRVGTRRTFVAACLLGVVLAGAMIHFRVVGHSGGAAVGGAAGSGACANAWTAPTAFNRAEIQDATLCLLNRERVSRGRGELVARGQLASGAGAYSRLMVREGFFAHASPRGTTLSGRVGRTGYLDKADGWSLGENLGWGTGRSRRPAGMVAAWMASPSHRKNLLTADFRDVGIGIAIGAPTLCSDAAATYTTDFGRRT